MPKTLRTAARILIWLLLALPLLAAAEHAAVLGKKGIAVSPRQDPDGSRLSQLHVHWYYNWTPIPTTASSESCFVPMYWGKDWQIRYLSGSISEPLPVLLTFNEPDHGKQANLSVSAALSQWPEISRLAQRLSAPAPANALGPWMRDFMDEASKRGFRSDFVPVHWFGPPDSKRFLEHLDKVHHLYNKPLWITEFAVSDQAAAKYGATGRYSEDDVVKFMKEVLPRLEQLDYVERYAWASVSPQKKWLHSSLLFTGDGQLTKVGTYYAMFNYRPDEVTYCGSTNSQNTFPSPATESEEIIEK